jgi:hypothetical protein
VLNTNTSASATANHLTDLVYELLDAHGDTMHLASGLDTDPEWAAHLDYLRSLQRVSREALARLAVSVHD